MSNLKPEDVVGIMVRVPCSYCKGKRRFPGGRYRDQGEVIDCPVCDGTGHEPKMVTIKILRELLEKA